MTVAHTTNSLNTFHIYPGLGSGGDPFHCHRTNTSETAADHKCVFATNGGFFDPPTGACLGNVVSNGRWDQLAADEYHHPTFALDHDKYLIGYMHNISSLDHSIREAVSGVGWLVRSGKSYLKESARAEKLSEAFLKEIAPRTAIGITHDPYDLVIVVVDGEEDIKSGVTLEELIEIALNAKQINALELVNLDGGGSSVAWYNGQIISKPTCEDTPRICERAVTTITCLA